MLYISHDIRTVRTVSDRILIMYLGRRDFESARRFRNRWILQMDSPEHDQLRSIVARAFTPRRMEQFVPRIVAITDQVLSEVADRREIDLVTEIAAPIVGMSICDFVGAPHEDWLTLRRWADHIVGIAEPTLSHEAKVSAAHAAVWMMKEYSEQLLRSNPNASGPAATLAAGVLRGALTEGDAVGMTVLLLSAGHHSTVHMICNGVLALLTQAKARAQLQSGGVPTGTALEELLRFDSAAGLITRRALEDIELDGVLLRRGSTVALAVGAANRDPEVFALPDRLDLARAPNPHLSFGHGPHYCLGAALARAIGIVVFKRLFAYFPGLALARAPTSWTARQANHGPTRLDVQLQAGAHPGPPRRCPISAADQDCAPH